MTTLILLVAGALWIGCAVAATNRVARFLYTTAAVLMLLAAFMSASPAQAVTWGPGDSGVAPAYSVPIHVVDTMASTLSLKHRETWRVARDKALSEWGVPFYVTRLPETSLPYLYDADIGTTGIDGMLTPDTVTIVRSHNADVFTQGGYSPTVNAGIVILTPWKPWWDRQGSPLTFELAHEYGHAIGFQHGGNGVMMGAFRVNDQERQLASAYYI